MGVTIEETDPTFPDVVGAYSSSVSATASMMKYTRATVPADNAFENYNTPLKAKKPKLDGVEFKRGGSSVVTTSKQGHLRGTIDADELTIEKYMVKEEFRGQGLSTELIEKTIDGVDERIYSIRATLADVNADALKEATGNILKLRLENR